MRISTAHSNTAQQGEPPSGAVLSQPRIFGGEVGVYDTLRPFEVAAYRFEDVLDGGPILAPRELVRSSVPDLGSPPVREVVDELLVS